MKAVKNLIRLLVAIVILSCGLIFGLDNNTQLSIHFLSWQTTELPIYQWLFIFLATGFGLGMLFIMKTTISLQLQVAQLTRKNKVLTDTAKANPITNLAAKSEAK